jgi:Reverse transcriptase (RNA-dependent DNA polymerase)
MENGKQVLYVQLAKALYGTLKAAMLFGPKLTEFLEGIGFATNPYDCCVANKIVDGKQCTVAWHVDDLKISHVDSKVVDSVIASLESEFGKEAPLTVTRGKIHEYLGMTLDYSMDGKVMIKMFRYIRDTLAELPADMKGEKLTPAAAHLFDVRDDTEKLSEEKAEFFHHCVAKLLFLCKRARPDIQTAIAFLCTRVQAPDTDDYKKLARVMQYLRDTVEMPLTLECDGTGITRWWADASFAVHTDARSHTGGCMSLGGGVTYGTSTRQKLTTRSSTEAELVAADDVMGQLLWTQYFLQGQGFENKAVLFQDNQAAMLLEKNGQASSGKRTRHLNIRYYFITDRISKQELTVEYCPTKEMLADFFTKPLQGSLFRTLRDQVMNVDPSTATDSASDRRSVLERDELGVTLAVTCDNGKWNVVTRSKRVSRMREASPLIRQ